MIGLLVQFQIYRDPPLQSVTCSPSRLRPFGYPISLPARRFALPISPEIRLSFGEAFPMPAIEDLFYSSLSSVSRPGAVRSTVRFAHERKGSLAMGVIIIGSPGRGTVCIHRKPFHSGRPVRLLARNAVAFYSGRWPGGLARNPLQPSSTRLK